MGTTATSRTGHTVTASPSGWQLRDLEGRPYGPTYCWRWQAQRALTPAGEPARGRLAGAALTVAATLAFAAARAHGL